MKSIVIRTLLLIGLGMASATAVADQVQAPQTYDLRLEMTVGADGKSSSLKSLTPLPELIDQRVQQWVGRLQFAPATVDGIPKPATTILYLTLGQVVLVNGQSGYGITSLSTGPGLVRGTYKYPRDSGAGYFVVSYDKSGHTIQVRNDASVPLIGGRRFQRWALDLAKSFRFAPETVDGTAVAGEVRIPFISCTGGDSTCPELAPLPPDMGDDVGGAMVAKSVLALKSPIDNESI